MSMRRPTKYNQEVADRLILFIEQGLTIKDGCCEVGISPDTCSRWRQKYPEFCREVYGSVEKATFLGGSADALAKYHHYRPYRRKVGVCLPSRQKPLREPLRGSQGFLGGRVGGDRTDDEYLPIIVI